MTAREEFQLLRNEIGAINHVLSNVTCMSAVDYELIECVIKDLEARKAEAGKRLYAEMEAAAKAAQAEKELAHE